MTNGANALNQLDDIFGNLAKTNGFVGAGDPIWNKNDYLK